MTVRHVYCEGDRPIQRVLDVTLPGDTVKIHAGVYTETLDNLVIRSTSWTKKTLIIGSSAILKPTTGQFVLRVTGAYIELSDLEIDASGVDIDGVKLTDAVHHIRLRRVQVHDARYQGLLSACPGLELLQSKFYRNGHSGQCHGVYHTADHALISECDLDENYGYGLHLYDGSGQRKVSYNRVQFCRARNNSLKMDAYGAGYLLASGDGNSIYRSMASGNRSAIHVWEDSVSARVIDCDLRGNTPHPYNPSIPTTVWDKGQQTEQKGNQS